MNLTKNNKFFKITFEFRIMRLVRILGIILLFIALIGSSFLIVFNLTDQNSSQATKTSVSKPETGNSWLNSGLKKVSTIGANTVFYTPSLSIPQPTSTTPNIVYDSIFDANKVKNATLFWTYNDLNNTLYNTSMTVNYNKFIFNYAIANSTNSNAFYNSTQYLNSDGTFASGRTNRITGVVSYIPNTASDTYGNNLSITLVRFNSSNAFTYLKVERLNATSGNWDILRTQGTINGTTAISTGNIAITDNNLSLGYRISTSAYNTGGFPSLPKTATGTTYNFRVRQNTYTGTIKAPGKPTHVSYYIKAFNGLNIASDSSTYQYITDFTPTIVVYPSTTSITSSESYFFNATVTDQDGVADIIHNSVVGIYYNKNPNTYSQITMKYDRNISSTALVFNVTLSTSFLSSYTGNLYIYVNASDSVGIVGKSSNILTLPIDNSGPSLLNYTLNASRLDYATHLYRVYNTSQVPYLQATMQDGLGIHDVTVYYSVNGGSYSSIKMLNETFNDVTKNTMIFNATLPKFSTTTIIYFYLVSHDFGGNSNTTPTYRFYFDNDAPVLDQSLLYPPSISNITTPLLLFNVTDLVGSTTPLAYYSYNGQQTWISKSATAINYYSPSFYRNSTIYTFPNTPYPIPQGATTNLTKRIVYQYHADQALLNLSITHTQGSYLRIWISNDLGKQAIVFDRISGAINRIYSIDLIKLGFTANDFKNSTFSLIIEDDSVVDYGTINSATIRLRDYVIPLGYQYEVKLPATGNDTMAYYFYNLKDFYNHIANTTVKSFYADGTIPNITVVPTGLALNQSLDLAGSNRILVNFTASDKGGLFLVELYYKQNNSTNSNNWNIIDLKTSYLVANFSVSILINSENGTLYYKIRAFDNTGFSNSTKEFMIGYINGNLTSSNNSSQETNSTTQQSSSLPGSNDLANLALTLVGGVVVVGVVGGGGYYGYKKLNKSGKLSSYTSSIKEKISSKKPKT